MLIFTSLIVLLIGALIPLLYLLAKNNRKKPDEKQTKAFIRGYKFPNGMIDRAIRRCPPDASPEMIEKGLRQFLVAAGACMAAGKPVAMPSKTVDEAWHEFITYTRSYAEFCEQAYGQMLHHQPVETMTPEKASANQREGMLAAWVAACAHEKINPYSTPVAPVLFRCDRENGITEAPVWKGDCNREDCPKGTQCAVHVLMGAVGVNAETVRAANKKNEANKKDTEPYGDSGGGGEELPALLAMYPGMGTFDSHMEPAGVSSSSGTVDAGSSCGGGCGD